jgi:predicted  nucleic acid-binding Zn-ribbon protein
VGALEGDSRLLAECQASLAAEVQRAEQERKLYTDCIDELSAEREALGKEVARLEQELQALRARLDGVDNERLALEKEVEILREVTTRQEALGRDNQRLMIEVEKLQDVGRAERERLERAERDLASMAGRERVYETGLHAILGSDSRGDTSGIALIRGEDLVGRLAERMEGLRSLVVSKAEEVEAVRDTAAEERVRAAGELVALREQLHGREESVGVLEEAILAVLAEVLGREGRRREAAGGGACQLATCLREAVDSLKQEITATRVELDALHGAPELMTCVQALVGHGESSQQIHPQELCHLLRSQWDQQNERLDALTKKSEHDREAMLSERRLLNEEFGTLKAQIEAWGQSRKAVEEALQEVLELPRGEEVRWLEIPRALRSLVNALRQEVDQRGGDAEKVCYHSRPL